MKTESNNRASWISKKPGRCGGAACIRDLRMPVWALVNYRRLAGGEADILQAYPTLTRDDLDTAWEYYDVNKKEIDRAIQENEQGEEGFAE